MKLLTCAQIIFGKICTQKIVVASGKENCMAEETLSLFALIPFEFCIMCLFSDF